MNLYSNILYFSKEYQTFPAIISYDDNGRISEEISYSKLKEKIEIFATFLLNLHLTSGDSFAIALRNSPELLLLSWAAWSIGIVTVPLDLKRDTLEEHIYKIKLSKAKLLVTKNNELSNREIKKLGNKVGIISLDDIRNIKIRENLPWKSNLDHEALILFTSGTTSRPKGAKLSLKNLVVNAESIKKWLKIGHEDSFMVNLPLHHINSTTFCLSTLLAGGSISIFSNYSNSRFWERIAISGSTFTSIVPSICFDQLSRRKEFDKYKQKIKMNRIQIGSAPVVVSDVKDFMQFYKIPLYQGYGQTETSLRVTGVPMDIDRNLYEKLVEMNSIGKPMEWAEVEIMDEKGKVLKEGEEGEIAVKGEAVIKGYIGINEGFRDRYFLTGDIGYFKIINGERYFFLKGRKKEIIIKGGINISPVAVEDKLKKIYGDIDQVFVVGVDDRRYGEEIGAVICWRKDIDVKKAITNLKYKLIRGSPHISSYESPRYLVSFDSTHLPMTSTGKVQRSKLKNTIKKDDFETVDLIYKNSNYSFLYLLLNSSYFREASDLYNYCWDPLRIDVNEFKKQISNGLGIVAVDKDEKVQGLILLIRTNINEKILSAISHKELTDTGEKSVVDDDGDKFVCVAICSANYKPYEIPKVKITPSIKDVERYLFSGLDGVYNFHTKAKGGLEKGAILIEIISNSRPEDKSSIGYNMLMKYPKVDRKIEISENANVSTQLIEVVLYLAWQLGVENVYAFSRPGGLAKYLAFKNA